ncbi:potassium voltage-gated channel protein egl-36-like [Mercenaria mercenaria]|uniref:potassium voltage-gated channel protein egl-36-like n=1 Tax=Mercenaria mercenaria TaxID=6596 RepID=UPI00234EC43D|nr:potassium voltage-gated channel protein egl-36-like [Mercenaria mercenaria]
MCTAMDSAVEIDLSGTIFKTKRLTLKAINGSYLSKLNDTVNKYYFDKDPTLFRHILNAHRDGTVHVPRDVCPMLFKKELLFWNIPLSLVAPCCWKYLYEAESDVETFKILLQEENKYDSTNKVDEAQVGIKQTMFAGDSMTDSEVIEDVNENQIGNKRTRASRVWLFLEEPGSSAAAKIWCFFYIFVVILSVVAYIIWLDPSVRVSQYLTKNPKVDALANQTIYEYMVYIFNEKVVLLASTDPHPALLCLDIFCVVFFILEALVHFSMCPDKRNYFLNAYHLLKIFLCISMIISTYFECRKDLLDEHDFRLGEIYHAFKSCYALRLLLIFRLHKIYNGLHIMVLSLRYSVKELLLLGFSFLIAVVVYGCLIFSAEIETDMFPSTQIAMWWSLITMTTIGYGDFYPTTTWGYVVGIVCAINGLIVLALPIAAIASTFSSLYSRNADFQKHMTEVRKQKQILCVEKETLMHCETFEIV